MHCLPYRELPVELQKKIGPLPDGFLAYFAGRYPGLLMTCYFFSLKWCSQEPVFQVGRCSSVALLDWSCAALVQLVALVRWPAGISV